ncbi:MAG: hypothetical protein LBT59_03885 [Clostridiales bacterium]|nr:hypothetical protein [Clostridiales bacterium]
MKDTGAREAKRGIGKQFLDGWREWGSSTGLKRGPMLCRSREADFKSVANRNMRDRIYRDRSSLSLG